MASPDVNKNKGVAERRRPFNVRKSFMLLIVAHLVMSQMYRRILIMKWKIQHLNPANKNCDLIMERLHYLDCFELLVDFRFIDSLRFNIQTFCNLSWYRNEI